MNSPGLPYRIFPLGDNAVTVDYGNSINEIINNEVIARFHELQQEPLPGMIEVAPAYSSFTVYYDILAVRKAVPAASTAFMAIKEQLEKMLQEPSSPVKVSGRLIRVPVCYENGFAPDLHYLAAEKNMAVEKVVQLHSSRQYKVYMLGFLPGFSYMGEVDDRIAIPRKPQPQFVEAGGIGIAGKQTGIYPLGSPGGWQIIGRTPWKIFDISKEEPALLKAGDEVIFYSITKDEFENH